MSIQPVVPNLPSFTRAFTNKYSTGSLAPPQQSAILQALAQLPAPRPATQSNVINPLALYEAARANRGLSPLSPRQSAAALKTLATGQPATPPRRQGIFRSALGNLRQLVTSIPKLPMALYDEAGQLLDLPQNISGALAESSNPLNMLGNLAAVPGLRMIPGAFVAEQLAGNEGQGIQGLAANPLFTALDLLPLASGVAKTTKVARTARDAYAGQVEALKDIHVAKGFDASTTILPREPRPLTTALTRTLDPTGQVVPNRLGRGIQSAAEDFRGTDFGNNLTATFRERFTPRISAEANTFIGESVNPRFPTEALRPNVPGGHAAMTDELVLHAMKSGVNERLTPALEAWGRPSEDFYAAITGTLDDGRPIPPEQMLSLTPELRTIARDIRDYEYQNSVYTDALPGTESTRSLNVDGTRETYDYKTGTRVSKAQYIEAGAREIQEARALAQADTPPNIADLDARIADVQARRAANEMSPSQARELIKIYEVAKYPANNAEVSRIIPTLRPLSREYPPVTRLIDAIGKGRWAQANKELSALAATRYGRALPFDIADLKAAMTQLGKRDRALTRTAHVTDRYVERTAKIAKRVEDRAAPARFGPLLEAQAREGIVGHIKDRFATSPDLDTFVKLAYEGIYDTAIAADPSIARLVREEQSAANTGWKAMRDAGHDPIFLARVTPAQAARQAHPRISDRPMSLRSVRARMMDAAPYVKNVAVILDQQSLDILSRRGTQAMLDRVGESHGRTRAALVGQYTERLLANTESAIPMKARLAQMIARGWEPFNPGEFGGKQKAAVFSPEAADTIYIPRAMATNLRKMYSPKESKLTSIFDRPMNAFRTSVLPLAVRWQINNGVSGIIVTAVEDPRAFLEMPNVIRDMYRENKAMPAAAERMRPMGMPPPGVGSESPDLLRIRDEINANSAMKDRVGASAQFASGTTGRRLLDAARDDRISKIRDFTKRKIEQSYGANQMVDDMFRASMGRAKMKKYLGKGYSEEAASALAASSIRRVFQAWDEMTPMERSVMRSMVPFYGFAAYSTRFVLNYAMDHPLRVSVLGSIARAELDDAMTGLPEYIREMILLGDPRANGVVRVLNVSPFNPFGGVPSMFTVAGFLGQLNPVITGVLKSVGVDVQRGGPSLYPELRYDPESGRLVADPSGNLVSNVAGGLIPQVTGIQSLLGWNDKFNETLARDPAAAGRMLLSNFGMPILTREVNVGEQLIRSEMARFEDQETARKSALSSGNLSLLNDFPGLAAYGEQIRALDKAGMLDAIRKPSGDGVPGGDSKAGVAYAAQAALTGS